MSDYEPQSFTTDRRFPWLLLYALACIVMPVAVWVGNVPLAVVGAAFFLQAGAQLRAIRRELVERGLEL